MNIETQKEDFVNIETQKGDADGQEDGKPTSCEVPRSAVVV